MFAVIKTGGKQYKVAPNDVLRVEKLEAEPGETIALESVLMLDTEAGLKVGTPLVEGATVAAEVLEQTRGPKVVVFKKKRRKYYRRRNGHRQDLTVLRVTEFLTDGAKPTQTQARAQAKAAKETGATGAAASETAQVETATPKKAAPKKPAAKKATAKKAPAKKAAPKKAAASKAAKTDKE